MNIEIAKSVSNTVSIYVSFPHAVSIAEAERFKEALSDAIYLAAKWQTGNQFARPGAKDGAAAKPEPEKVKADAAE